MERLSSAPVGITSAGRGPLGPASNSLGAQATGADARGAMHAAVVNPHRLEVGQPAALGLIHRVADVVARLRTLSTNFAALRHSRQIVPWAHAAEQAQMLTRGKESRGGSQRPAHRGG